MADPSHLDDDADALYALRPGEFTAARDALAKRLRGEGRRDEAAAVKALARPTVAAWAVNQLARGEPEWIQALATAGRRLEEAQAALLERGDRDAWREATAGQREAIDRLAKLAERLVVEERGAMTPALHDQIRETLQAATIDAEARQAVAEGRLSRELRASGTFGAGAGAAPAKRSKGGKAVGRGRAAAPPATAKRGASPAPAPAEPDAPAPDDTAARRAAAAAAERESRSAQRAAERDARSVLRRAEKDAAPARTAAQRAEQAVTRARKAHDAAAAALSDAHEAERERATELAAAEDAERDAAAALREREAAIEQARAALDDATG